MKTCPYCGAEYSDDTVVCVIDQTPLTPPPLTRPSPQVPDAPRPKYEFAALTEAQLQMDLVTLVRCATLLEADLIASRLRAEGIEVFIPDQSVVQAVAFNLNAVGYVRVQLSPADYNRAKDILSS